MLVALWVVLLYGLFGLVLTVLYITDLEWRREIGARLRGALKSFRGAP